MATKKRASGKTNKVLVWGLMGLTILAISFLIYRRNYHWSTYVANGQITSRIFEYKDTLIFGTNLSKLYFLDKKYAPSVHTIDLNSGNGQPQDLAGKKLVVVSDDTLRLINVDSRKVDWQISTNNQYFFESATIYKKYVFAGSADGSLWAIDLASGKIMWKFDPQPLTDMDSVLVPENLHYFGFIKAVGNYVYLASQDKSFYALSIKDGSVAWKTDVGGVFSSEPVIKGEKILIGLKSGASLALNISNGAVIWKSSGASPVICSNVLTSPLNSDRYYSSAYSIIKQGVVDLFSPRPLAYFEYHNNGQIVRRDIDNGEIVWQSRVFGKSVACPKFWRSEIYIVGMHGNIDAIYQGSGNVIFEKNIPSGIIDTPMVFSRVTKLLPDRFNLFSPNLYVKSVDGSVYLLNGKTGEVKWKFSSVAPSDRQILIDGNDLFLTTSDGVIYKLNKNTGEPSLDYKDSSFKVDQTTEQVGNASILELSLTSDGKFLNPWREADIEAVFTNDSGDEIKIPGFYYDNNIWKIRFNPPKKGEWNWVIRWTPHGKTLIKKGSFDATTDSSQYYLKLNAKNPQRLTLDGLNIFNGIGIGDLFFDINYNGTPMDDWAAANSEPVVATNSSGFTSIYRSDKINTLSDYISLYGPDGAGFNIFRWSLDNGSQPIYLKLGYPTVYSIIQGKIGDDLAKNLRSNGIHIWLTLFGFDVPYKNSDKPVDQYILKSYVRYMYARYGAYVDVWEVANEVAVPKETAQLIKEEIASLDYEKRPISISSNAYNINDGNILAPHWYETENLSESDVKTRQKIDQYTEAQKPVVFAEQGNLGANFDATSGIRMRVRAWTAFMEQAILIFWNQSESKNHASGIFPANLYIGSEERSYISILERLTSSFSLSSSKSEYNLSKDGVRGYGIASDSRNLIYFFHYKSPFTRTKFSMMINTRNGGDIEWLEPSDGKVLQTGHCNPGYCQVSSPSFTTDVVLAVGKF